MPNPTSEPVQELILQDVEGALALIDNGTGTYWNTFAHIERRNAGQATVEIYPMVIVSIIGTETRDDLDSDIHSLNVEDLLLNVEVYHNQIDDIPLLHQRTLRDVRTALMVDPRRNSNAIHTYITHSQSWYPEKVGDPISIVEVDVRVRYRTRVDSLETSA